MVALGRQGLRGGEPSESWELLNQSSRVKHARLFCLHFRVCPLFRKDVVGQAGEPRPNLECVGVCSQASGWEELSAEFHLHLARALLQFQKNVRNPSSGQETGKELPWLSFPMVLTPLTQTLPSRTLPGCYSATYSPGDPTTVFSIPLPPHGTFERCFSVFSVLWVLLRLGTQNVFCTVWRECGLKMKILV